MTTAMGKVLADWAAGTEARDLPLPFTPPAPIPFHGLLRHAPNMLWAGACCAIGWTKPDRADSAVR